MEGGVKEAGAPRKGAHPGWGVEAAGFDHSENAGACASGRAPWDWAGYFGLDSQ